MGWKSGIQGCGVLLLVSVLGAWGCAGTTKSAEVTPPAANEVKIFSTGRAFAALKTDGSVVTWGKGNYGGDSSGVDLSSGVVNVFSTAWAFAALKSDGSVVTWGRSDLGGDSSKVDLSSGVVSIFSSNGAFAAVKTDGSVVTWGDKDRGGDSSKVADVLRPPSSQ